MPPYEPAPVEKSAASSAISDSITDMTFDDLPKNFRDLSLDDPILRSDAVDLFVSLADREDGSFAALLLDEDHRIVQPVLITEMGPADATELAGPLEILLREIRPPAIVGAIGRQGSPLFTDVDRQCHQLLVDLCRTLDVDLLGFLVATDGAVREMPSHLRIAS